MLRVLFACFYSTYVFRAECVANKSQHPYAAIINHKTQHCTAIIIEHTQMIVAMMKVKQVLHPMIFSPQEGEHDPAIVKQFTLRRIPFVLWFLPQQTFYVCVFCCLKCGILFGLACNIFVLVINESLCSCPCSFTNLRKTQGKPARSPRFAFSWCTSRAILFTCSAFFLPFSRSVGVLVSYLCVEPNDV